MTARSVTSPDGTRIAYEQVGSGPPLLLVDGAFCSREFGPMRALAKHLAPRFTVTFYDRRGRGASSDATATTRPARHPSSVEREVEDVAALASALGGEPYLYGCSSGAVLAARAVAAGVRAKALAIYEPPLALDGTHRPAPADFIERIDALLAAGRRRDAVKLFMRVVGMPGFAIFIMQLFPGVFSKLDRAAPTLPHDFAILGDTQRGGPLPDELASALGTIRAPTTVMSGGKSPAWMKHAAERVAACVPGASTRVVPGQNHNVSAKAIGPILSSLFASS